MAESLNLVFCGTPSFAVPSLSALVEAGFSVQLIVTQPDRPRGRGMDVAFSPVKQRALQLGLPLAQPAAIKNNEDFRHQLASLQPDAIVVVGYGRIIPNWMLELPRFGNINLHASLLPKYRGAAPVQWAIANGETMTGVTTMRIDAGLDTGDVLLQEQAEITADDTAETLGPRLAQKGAKLLVETFRGLLADTIQPMRQDDLRASLAPILTKQDGRIDFHKVANEIYSRLRGFQPWPGAFTTFRGRVLNVWAARQAQRAVAQSQLLDEENRLFVGCGEGTSLELLEVQPEGKKRMAASDFIHGYRPHSGEQLGG
jgi:methionyl-tRNA formyltransferase